MAVPRGIERETSSGEGTEEGSAGSHAEQPAGRTKSNTHTGDQSRRQQLLAASKDVHTNMGTAKSIFHTTLFVQVIVHGHSVSILLSMNFDHLCVKITTFITQYNTLTGRAHGVKTMVNSYSGYKFALYYYMLIYM